MVDSKEVAIAGRSGPLVVGISGATCGGKTTLSKLLQATFPWASVVHQDAYFHPNDEKYHTYLPEIDCFNWELETALDFERMENDVKNLLLLRNGKAIASQETPFFENEHFVRTHQPSAAETRALVNKFSHVPLIILEGHILFNRDYFNQLCDHKFFLTLGREECFRRRQLRRYEPPPPQGFFELCVWPSYEGRLSNVRHLPDVTFVNAEETNLLEIYRQIKKTVADSLVKLTGL